MINNLFIRCLRDIGGRFNSNQMSTTMIFPSCNKTLDREIYPLDILVVEGINNNYNND